MEDIGIRLLLALLCFGFAAFLWKLRREGEQTGEMWVHIAVTFYREKSPIAFKIASWGYVVITVLWAGVGIVALLPPHFLNK
jgi:hypothetical protein